MTDQELLGALESEMRRFDPKYRRVKKTNSWFMRMLNVVAQIFNPKFMTNYTTVVPPVVYMPDKLFLPGYTRSTWKILAHEFVHMVSSRDMGRVSMWLGYFFPQNLAFLAIFSLLALWFSGWWVICLVFLAFLAPLPAPFRADEEHTAYAMSMAVNYWRYGTIEDFQIDWVVNQFVSSSYYFMWPFKRWVTQRVEAEALKVVNGEYDNVYPFNHVKTLVQNLDS